MDQLWEAARSHGSAAQGEARSPYRAVLASDATPRCASMASADRQMIGDATLVTAVRQRDAQRAGAVGQRQLPQRHEDAPLRQAAQPLAPDLPAQRADG